MLRTKTIKQIKPALTLHVPHKSEIKKNFTNKVINLSD